MTHVRTWGAATLLAIGLAPTVVPAGGGAAPAGADGIVGYHVYRAAAKAGPYTRLTDQPVKDTRFADPKPATKSWYMVRTVKLQSSPSGTYFNASQGASVQAPQ